MRDFQNEVQLYATVELGNSRAEKHSGVDGGVSMNVEALEADLFEQSVQIMR